MTKKQRTLLESNEIYVGTGSDNDGQCAAIMACLAQLDALEAAVKAMTAGLLLKLTTVHQPPKRKAIAYVVKYRGNYLYELPSAWTAQLACAIRYAPHDKQGAEMRAKGLNARVVAVVRKREVQR